MRNRHPHVAMQSRSLRTIVRSRGTGFIFEILVISFISRPTGRRRLSSTRCFGDNASPCGKVQATLSASLRTNH